MLPRLAGPLDADDDEEEEDEVESHEGEEDEEAGAEVCSCAGMLDYEEAEAEGGREVQAVHRKNAE